ncbi:hypothetical protein F4777DRAFT_573144 [Nemania sp. FL0916]|nr:hypothetical protein F4777DRAFT_573144 [Nemania sp. FL0916]
MSERTRVSTPTYHAPRQVLKGAPAPAAARLSRRRAPWTTSKRLVYTLAFAAVTIVGSIYGAGLKMQQEYKAEKKHVLESPVEDRIRVLEIRRAHLVKERLPLEQKLEKAQARLRIIREQEERERGK